MSESLNGLIERVTYHNPENGFAVLRVQVKGRKDLVTVTGSTTSVTAGEHVEANVGNNPSPASTALLNISKLIVGRLATRLT